VEERLAQFIYLARRTAPASDTALRGILALRKVMFDSYGEERQRKLVAAWNDLPLPWADGDAVTGPARRLAEEGIGRLWIEAGMPRDTARRLDHLFHTMFDLMKVALKDDEYLFLEIDERLAQDPPGFSSARIIANMALARAMYQGDAGQIAQSAHRVQDILFRWKAEEHDCSRDDEIEEVRWVIENADNIDHWSHMVRARLGAIWARRASLTPREKLQ
jgi:hypothetical protein